ncbi:pilus assembly protein TadG-related protein [Motilibacter deserti]|uniref:Putative Flp pilus-assembly TadG-like N-terminal domain-containing protein n=1 Tax=Motilibacter deserti TaxID=2714956 RepID=A0ABX0GQD2_9ACTN|nr:pilus assembly protein TadG-related protein [Motilibacter deserti]NHC12922.1 hypothetical protein [Motilibacter deserti]
MTSRRPRGDTGTITPLILGFAVVVMALIAVVTDVSSAYLARRTLAGAADSTALAAAGGVDRDRLYDGSLTSLPLSASAARARADRQLTRTQLRAKFPDARVARVALDESRTTVTVQLAATARLPFTGILGFGRGSVRLTAAASARSPLG